MSPGGAPGPPSRGERGVGDRVGVEIALDAIELLAQQRYFLRGDPGKRDPVHLSRVWQQHFPQPLALVGEMDIDLAPVHGVTRAADEPAPLHVFERGRRGRLHHPDPPAELALGEPVFFPQRAQEVPHADTHTVARHARAQGAEKRAMSLAHQVADALVGRKIRGCLPSRRSGRCAFFAGLTIPGRRVTKNT